MGRQRSRFRRLLALALLCLLLAPGTWLRETSVAPDQRNILSARKLGVVRPADWPSSLQLLGVWQLESPNTDFGGYSGMMALPRNRLLAYSDRGGVLAFTPPVYGELRPDFQVIPISPAVAWNVDFESVASDPVTGRRWLGSETVNAIVRLSPDGVPEALRRPPEMQDWPKNRGAEAMVRLADGRFIVLGERESPLSLDPGPGLLFPGDPVEESEALSFRFLPPAGFVATDMAALPDGRVLLLLRGLGFGIPPFRGVLALADPALIRPGEEWPWTWLAEFSPPLPRDNYEGLAVTPTRDGGADIWIISDDNHATLQRTLLIGLHLEGVGKRQTGTPKGAAGEPGAPL